MADQEPPDNLIGRGRWPVSHGGSGPHDPSVEARLARLASVVDAIRLDLAEIKGKLSNMPTTFQLVYMQGGFVLAIFAAAFTLLRYAPPH
jgi:hypothetical protein